MFMALLIACSSCDKKVIEVTELVNDLYERTSVPSYIAEQFGPFGPLVKSYPVPDEGAIFVAPDGDASLKGESIRKPTTIEHAVEIAETGDVLVLRGGVYRTGNLSFDTEITIQPYKDERPVLKGTKVAANWEKRGDYWVTKWDNLHYQDPPKWWKPGGRDGPAVKYNDDLVLFDGEMFRPVSEASELESGYFYCNYADNEVYIVDDPTGKEVEIVVYEYGLIREHGEGADPKGPTILGMDILGYAQACVAIRGDDPYRIIELFEMPDAPVGTHIENCRLLFSPSTGLSITSPESYIAYNDISMIGNCAMTTRMSHNSMFEHNVVSHSDWFDLRIYPAGIKVFNQCHNYTVRNNYFGEMPCEAVWYDVGHREGKAYNNYLYNCGMGLKIEICHKSYVAGNVFVNSDLWFCNSNSCMAYNNTMINSRIDLWRNNRGAGGWNKNYSFNHVSTGPGVENYHGHHVANNVFAGSEPRGDFYALIEDNNNYDTNFHADVYTHNTFLKQATWTFNAQVQPLGLTNPVKYENLEDLEEVLGKYVYDNAQLEITQDELFMAKDAGDYRLKDVEGLPEGIAVPEEIAELLGWDQAAKGLGAFPRPLAH